MTIFRRRKFVRAILVLTEARCLEIARELHLGTHPRDVSKLLEDAMDGVFTTREEWPRA